jgi:hypothetical protein
VTIAAGRDLIGSLVPGWANKSTSEVTSQLKPVEWWVVGCSALLPTILTAAWLVADVLQPPSYSPVRQTVSVLSGYAGTDRWLVTAALYLVGIGYLIIAAGLGVLAVPARVGLIVAAVAAIAVASFPEPVHGSNRPHELFTAIGAIAIAVWPAIVTRQESVYAAVGARRTVTAIVVSLVLFLWTAIETRGGSALGLAERMSSAVQAGFPFVVVLALRRAQHSAARGG